MGWLGCEKINYGIIETKDLITVRIKSWYYVNMEDLSIDIKNNKLRIRKGKTVKMIPIAQEPIEIVSIVSVYNVAYKRSFIADPIPIGTTGVVNGYIVTIRKINAGGH